MKLKGIKKGMSQLWQNDIVVPVTEVLVKSGGGDMVFPEAGTKVTVVGTSKGKGFQGVVKRHGFSGGPKSHGTKKTHRTPGSIGSTDPQRVMPGKRMAGRMGRERVTVKNLKVAHVDAEKKQIFIRGAVPGVKGGAVEVISK